MNKKLTLVIMAAGLGSRFGGLKQIEPVGPNGEFIIDYSIYDAIEVGFEKIVFVIKQENYEVFKNTIGKKLEGKVEVAYAFQSVLDLPSGISFPNRVKPLGTAHAVYAARGEVDGHFAVINADDFYGRDAFLKIAEFLKQDLEGALEKYAMVGYKVENTLTENGAVKRGICEIKDHYLVSLNESSIEKEGDCLVATSLENGKSFVVADDTLVSMNMLGFSRKLFSHIEEMMYEFYEDHKDNLEVCEYLLPTVITKCIARGIATMEVLPTDAVWHGVTYREDKEELEEAIMELIDRKVYPVELFK